MDNNENNYNDSASDDDLDNVFNNVNDDDFNNENKDQDDDLNIQEKSLLFAEEFENLDLLPTPLNSTNIVQGILGDCYLLTSLSLLSTRKNELEKIFVTKKYSKYGFYIFQFYIGGKWLPVVIDDHLPYNEDDELIFAKSKNPKEIWPSLVEKAYAKLFGSFEALQGGLVHSTLSNLTGGSSEMVSLLDPETIQDIHNGKFWNKLLNYFEAGYLIGTGSNSGRDSNISNFGIVYGHAYAILDIRFVDSKKMIKLRNPWGKQEWNGEYSRNSPSWNKKLKYLLNYYPEKSPEYGSFWIKFEDFIKHFRNVYVCRLFDPKIWKTRIINDEWIGESAGGSTNFDKCEKTTQYWLTVKQPTNCHISLTQEDPKFAQRNYWCIGLLIAKKNGKRIKTLYRNQEISSSGDYLNTYEVFTEVLLQPYSYPYTLFASTFRPFQEAKFTLTIRSDKPIQLEKIPMNYESE